MSKKIIDADWCEKNANPCPLCNGKSLYALSKQLRKDLVGVWVECKCGYGKPNDDDLIETAPATEHWSYADAFDIWQTKTK